MCYFENGNNLTLYKKQFGLFDCLPIIISQDQKPESSEDAYMSNSEVWAGVAR